MISLFFKFERIVKPPSGTASIGIVLAYLVGGCTPAEYSEYQRTRDLARIGLSVEIDDERARAWSERQQNYLESFNSGDTDLPAEGDNAGWLAITRSGMAYVDTTCGTYFEALDDYADTRRAVREGTGLIGTAAAALLGILDAASTSIAAVAGGFTLTQGLMDVRSESVLFPISPTSLRSLHRQAAAAYREFRIEQGGAAVTTRAIAVEAIGQYAALCTPVVLKSLIGDTLAEVQLGATAGGRIVVAGVNTQREGVILPDQPLRRTPAPADTAPAGAASDFERFLNANELMTLQRRLCVAEPAPRFGPKTRAAILSARQTLGVAPIESDQLDGTLWDKLRQRPELASDCPAEFLDVFERINLDTDRAVKGFLARLQQAGNELGLDLASGATLESARPKIRELAQKCGLASGARVTLQLSDIVRELAEGRAVAACGTEQAAPPADG